VGLRRLTVDRQRARGFRQRLDDPRSLIAVSARSNRSKADQDPSDWLPTFQPYHCQYLTDWIATKLRWQLTIDPRERDALDGAVTDCPNAPVKVTFAR